MLASPANQSASSETQVAENQARTANIMALEFSGAEHEPVLLSPGKWNIGSAPSNQIVLNCEGVAARQFLIIVTEHRSVIKDWSSRALWNGSPFDSTVIADGDIVEVANTRLVFRLAESLDLISQLPYVAKSDSDDALTSDVDDSEQAELPNTVRQTADGMLSFDDGEDRLDKLVSRIEASLADDDLKSPDKQGLSDQESLVVDESDDEIDSSLIELADDLLGRRADEAVFEAPAEKIDHELQQLEELRAEVERERNQLLAKRELLAQETRRVESQLEAVRQEERAYNTDDVTDSIGSSDAEENSLSGELENVEQPTNSEEAEHGDCEFGFTTDVSETFGNLIEDQSVAAEREKLRQYLEHFDSVDEAECEEAAEVEVAVGAAQAVSENSIMNALRSRDDAIKQLDDLVLAATGGQEPAAESGSSFVERASSPVSEEGGSSDSLAEEDSLTEENAAEEVHDCEQSSGEQLEEDVETENSSPDVDAEVSFEKLSTLLNNVENDAATAENESREEELDSSANDTVMFGGLHATNDSVVENESSGIKTVNVESSASTAEEPSVSGLDLSELTSGLDSAEAISSDVNDTESAVKVEFEDEVTSPLFGNDFAEECSESEVSSEPGASLTENIENANGSQGLNLQEDAEEQIVEVAEVGVPEVIEQEFESLDNASDVSLTDEEKFEPDTSSEPASQSAVSDQVDPVLPSWFDSKLMTEGDSEVDDDGSPSDADHSANDDGATSEDTESAEELRQKLAEMFDLPALSENAESVVPDNSLESHLNQFREEPAAENSAESGAGDAASLWPETGSSDVHEGPAGTFDFDLKEDVSAEAAETFESETLDEFPSTDSAEDVEPTVQADPQASSPFTPETDDGGEESITAYMEKLLARNRQVTGGSSASMENNDADSAVASQAASSETTSTADKSDAGSAAEEMKSENWLEATPRHSQNRDQVRAEVQKLRQIANQSARSAVATASRRDVRKQVIAKTIASVLSLGSGSAALLLDVSMLFGLVVLGIGLFFSADLTLTVFRNWKQLRDLRKAASSLVNDAPADNSETAAA